MRFRAPLNISEGDAFFATFLFVSLLIACYAIYGFAEAWLAPRCASESDMWWCIPNEMSYLHARISASYILVVILAAIGSAFYFIRIYPDRKRMIVYVSALATAGIIFLPVLPLALWDWISSSWR
jgi:hypothetical protein